jgi:hypothetical protein
VTINIALMTYDSIVLGCDSLSSIVNKAIFPYLHGATPAVDENGTPLRDQEGNLLLAMKDTCIKDVAVQVFGGVNKMFGLYEKGDTCVGAVTSGLAILEGVTIAEQAKRFKQKTIENRDEFESVESVARAFTDFIHECWERHHENLPYQSTVNFIIAGYGKNDPYGKIYKSDIQYSKLQEQFNTMPHAGVCWAGQADYVERLLLGVDSALKMAVGRELSNAMETQRNLTIDDISRALSVAHVELPADFDVTVTEHQPPTMPWQAYRADIDYGNLSTQYGIHLVEMLVNTQSGMQRFARGIPTVGGHTHIGVLKRGEGLALLNAPKLEHKHTGYAYEF